MSHERKHLPGQQADPRGDDLRRLDDQTIVAIAIPTIQDDLSLSATGVQWTVNGYLLSPSALFAFGGGKVEEGAEPEATAYP
jgi:hypothetical protein